MRREAVSAAVATTDQDVSAHPTPLILRMLRMPEVMERTGLRRTALYKLIAEGKFPAPTKIGAASLWPEHRVNRALATFVDTSILD